MFNHTPFPDAIVFPDGTIRLVTSAAKNFAYSNTDIRTIFTISRANAVPDYLPFDDTIPEMFEDAGLVVKRERQPVSHYRGKRGTSKSKRASNHTDGDYDGHRARFKGLTAASLKTVSLVWFP